MRTDPSAVAALVEAAKLAVKEFETLKPGLLHAGLPLSIAALDSAIFDLSEAVYAVEPAKSDDE